MLGLALREEFQSKRLKGTAIELSNDTNTGATQVAAQKFLSITYPTHDLLKGIEATGPNHGRPVVVIGERGLGKSHLMAALYHAVNDPISTGAWLKSWATTLGDPKIAEIPLRSGMNVIDAIQVRGNAASLLAELSAGWIKHIDGAPGETRYPTPAGAKWEDFVLEFTADEMITVSCKGQGHKQFSAEDLQMRDKRTKKPKQAWTFLQAMAAANGNMSVSDIDNVKKTKQEVSANLQRVFQLPDDDPIEWSGEDTAYKAKFLMRGGEKLTLSSARKRTA